jgi:hypothetical protein
VDIPSSHRDCRGVVGFIPRLKTRVFSSHLIKRGANKNVRSD